MPDWRDAIRAHLRGAGLSPSDEADVAEELRQHLDDHYEERRRNGAGEAEAHRSALAQLGEAGQLPRLLRTVPARRPEPVPIGARGGRGARGFLNDLRIGARLLARSPGFTVVAVLTLALGIGANTTIFSIVDALLLRPIPGVARPGALVQLGRTQRGEGFDTFSYPDFLDYRATARTLAELAAHFDAPVHLSTGAGSERLRAGVVSGDYFHVLGATPALGRFFRADEDGAPNAHPVVVLGHALWERGFGADPSVVGRTITLNAHPYTVIGVAPRGFAGIDHRSVLDLFVPIAMIGQVRDGFDSALGARDAMWLEVVARLAPASTTAAAETELRGIARRLARQYPETNAERGVAVAPGIGFDPETRRGVQTFTSILLGVVGLVLLIACANVANLLLARASARQRELSVRSSLGASRVRLVRQMLAEGLLLAMLGGVAGFVLGAWTAAWLTRMSLFMVNGVQIDTTPDLRVLAFTAAVALLSTLVFGLPAAFVASRVSLVASLKAGTPGGGGGRGSMRNALLVGQLALSLVLLVAAGLFVRTLGRLDAVDPGFDADRVLVATTDVALQGYDEARGRRFYTELERRAAALPGVRGATLAYMLPLGGGGWDTRVFPAERAVGPQDEGLKSDVNSVSASYFGALGMPLVRGRGFTDADRDGAPPVAIVNDAFARALWPGEDAIGKRYRAGRAGDPVEIVGVVRTAKYRSLLEPPRPFLYRPFGQVYQAPMTLHLATDGDPRTLAGAVRRLVEGLDPELPTYRVATLRERLDASIGVQRAAATLVGAYGMLALLVAAVGLYGSMAYTVARRSREIGIRMALGARAPAVLGQVLREAARLAALGTLIGVLLALPAGRLLRSQLFGVSPSDPVTLVVVGLVLGAVSLAAAYVPARRATRVDPVLALRVE